MKRIALLLATLPLLGGCITGAHGGTVYGSLLKEIDGTFTKTVHPDGRVEYKVEVKSGVSKDMLVPLLRMARPDDASTR